MKIGFILWGIVFLSNPYFTMIDVLPDFIGWMLLIRGLSPAFPVSASMQASENRLRVLLYASIVRFFLQPASFFFADSDRSMTLVLVLLFGLFEVIYALLAFSDIFAGYTYLSTRYGEEGKRVPAGALPFVTGAFFILRAVLNVVPELTMLSKSEEEYISAVVETETYPYAAYHTALLFFSTLLCALFGIVFLVCWIRKLKKIDRSGLPGAVGAEAALLPSYRGIRLIRSFRDGKFLMIGGCVFCGGLVLDGFELFPEFAACLLFLLSSLFLSALTPSFRRSAGWLIGAGAASGAAYALQIYFAKHFVVRGPERGISSAVFYSSAALQIVSSVLLIFALRRLCLSMEELIGEHCGMTAGEEFRRFNEKLEKDKKSMKIRFRVMTVGLGVLSLLGALNYATLYGKNPIVMIGKVPVTLTFWSFYLLLSLAWTVFSALTISSVGDQVREKYEIYKSERQKS